MLQVAELFKQIIQVIIIHSSRKHLETVKMINCHSLKLRVKYLSPSQLTVKTFIYINDWRK